MLIRLHVEQIENLPTILRSQLPLVQNNSLFFFFFFQTEKKQNSIKRKREKTEFNGLQKKEMQ